MTPRSLAFVTDMIFHRGEAVVTDLGDCLLVETPHNPSFYFGNLLHFAAPPREQDVALWPARFAAAFAGRPEVRHVTLAWDGPIGAAEAFVPLGYRVERQVVLAARAVHRPPKCDDGALVRPLASEEDFEAAVANHVALREPRFEAAGYERFTRAQFGRWRRMQAAGAGAWHGAFVEGQLVADCGLFFDDAAGVGRFQSVGTLPSHRRRGLCGRLVWEVAQAGLARVPTLVMVADALYHAARIYESVGFEPVEEAFAVCLEPRP
jgi:hypothetical protein